MGHKLNIDENLFERKPKNYAFPFLCGHKGVRISNYEGGRFECHWHREPEFTLVLEGEMEYQANDRIYHLQAGSGVFVNSNVIHTAWRCGESDCRYMPISFDPVLVYGYENCVIYDKNVSELLCCDSFLSLYLDPDTPGQLAILDSCRRLAQLRQDNSPVRELLIKAELCRLWAELDSEYRRVREAGSAGAPPKIISRIKYALVFMEENYREKLTLDEIAASCNISKSEFCRCFKQLMHQTPFDYLMRLRVRKSLPLLLDGGMSMTEISAASGFSNPSYYAEVFRRYMDITPTGYVRQQKGAK
ncbi:MAG: AraC family transcriptional regulator [Clostridia bacterium]|nr:AraC family transcriptional regulator [Clostridia bacterium]